MANTVLRSDQVTTIPIVTRAASGAIVPAPAGDVDSVVSSRPASLGMAIATLASGQAALVLTPLVLESDAGNGGGSIAAALTDTAGLPMTQASYLFDISPNPAPATIDLDTAHLTTAPQAPPTAPGP